MSQFPSNKLPASLDQDGVIRLCDVLSVLQERSLQAKMKNRHWYSRGEKYLRYKFDIKVILGPADIKFQLQTKDEKVFSSDHDTIQVKWERAKQISPGNPLGNASIYLGTP